MQDHDFKSLPLPKSGKINHIIHISDIHIHKGNRKESRFNEYMTVYSRLSDKINELPTSVKDSMVIIITGDFFDKKDQLDTNSSLLFNNLLGNLGKITQVYIIQGNHDYRQDRETDYIDEPDNYERYVSKSKSDESKSEGYDYITPDLRDTDVLSGLFHYTKRDNVTYIEKTGCYIAGDVGFGLVSVKDTLVKGGTSGQVSKLPNFPNDFPEQVKTKVALFHGTMINSKLQTYKPSTEGYPLDWIKGYDVWLLGDIHMQQVNNTKKVLGYENLYSYNKDAPAWGYPGSLIQQTFGETLNGHGYLYWNLVNSTVETVDIPNRVGKLVLLYQDNKWLVKNDGKWYIPAKERMVDISFLSGKSMLPKTLVIRTDGKNTEEEISTLSKFLHSKNISYHIIRNACSLDSEDTLTIKEIDDIQSCNSPDRWIEYVKEHYNNEILDNMGWEQWLKSPELLQVPVCEVQSDIKNKVSERNVQILKLSDILKRQSTLVKCHLSLVHMSWSWLFCYGASNWFDFNKSHGHIFEIKGENSTGKSCFYELICLALFNDQFPSRTGSNSSEFICTQKPDKAPATATLQFVVNGKQYMIKVNYCKKARSNTTQRVSSLYKLEGGEYTLLSSGNSAVDEWVKRNIGSINQFLLSVLITQSCDKNFFDMKADDQIELLDKSLDLEKIQELQNLFKESGLAYKALRDLSLPSYNSIPVDAFDESQLADVTKSYAEKTLALAELEKKKDTLLCPANNSDLLISDDDIHTKISEYEAILQDQESIESYEELLEEKGKLDKIISELVLTKPEPEPEESLDQVNYQDNSHLILSLQDKYDILMNNQPAKPTMDYKKITTEMEKLNSSTLTEFDYSAEDLSEEEKRKDKLETTQLELKREKEALLKNRPNKPKLDEKAINTSIQQFKEFTDSNLNKNKNNSISIMQAEFKKSPLVCPSMSLIEIQNMSSQLDKEKKKVEDQKWLSMTQVQLNKESTSMSNKSKKKEAHYEELVNAEKTISDDYIVIRSKIKAHESSLEGLKASESDCKPLGLGTSATECKLIIDEFNLKKKQYNAKDTAKTNQLQFFTEYEDRTAKIKETKDTIKSLDERIGDHADIEYNMKCQACLKNPGRLRLVDLKNQRTISQAILTNLENDEAVQLKRISMGIEAYRQSLEECVKWLQDYVKLEKEIPKWKVQLEEITKYNKHLLNVQNMEKELKELRITGDDCYAKLNTIQGQVKQCKSELDITTNRYKCIVDVKDKIDQWTSTAELIQKQTKMLNEYKERKKSWDILEKYNSLLPAYNEALAERLILKDYQTWLNSDALINKQIQELSTDLDDISKKIDKITQFIDLQRLCEAIKAEYDTYNTYQEWECKVNSLSLIIHTLLRKTVLKKLQVLNERENNEELLNYWSNLLLLKPIYKEKLEIDIKIRSIRDDIQQIAIQEDGLKKLQSNSKIDAEKREVYKKFIMDLDKRKSACEYLMKLFNGYKLWIYKTLVLPKLVDLTNTISGQVIKNGVYLEFDASTGGVKDKLLLNWNLIDGKNKSSIKRAGNYRGFIYGLAIRLAIAKMGASSLLSNQIFVDEGFVAGSKNSLEDVPNFIKYLKKLYDTIILVTHTDIIKETATSGTMIIKSGTSKLQFGEQSEYIVNTDGNVNVDTNGNLVQLETEKEESIDIITDTLQDIISSAENPVKQLIAKSTTTVSKKKKQTDDDTPPDSLTHTDLSHINQKKLMDVSDPLYETGKCRYITIKGTQCSAKAPSGKLLCKRHE